jgi:hypothetical protein
MSRKFVIAYLTILIAEIIAGEFGYTLGVYFLKPVIVSSLILLVASKGFLKNWQFITALSFSLLGDVFLMIGVPHLFLFGLGSFLLKHISEKGCVQARYYRCFLADCYGIFLHGFKAQRSRRFFVTRVCLYARHHGNGNNGKFRSIQKSNNVFTATWGSLIHNF